MQTWLSEPALFGGKEADAVIAKAEKTATLILKFSGWQPQELPLQLRQTDRAAKKNAELTCWWRRNRAPTGLDATTRGACRARLLILTEGMTIG
jgi:hypothetical protein